MSQMSANAIQWNSRTLVAPLLFALIFASPLTAQEPEAGREAPSDPVPKEDLEERAAPDAELDPRSAARGDEERAAPDAELDPRSAARGDEERAAPDAELDPRSAARGDEERAAPDVDLDPRSAARGDSDAAEQKDSAEDGPRDPMAELEQAFLDLRAEEKETWRAAEQLISKLWSRSGSPSMDFLLSRGQSAIERKDWDVAIEHLSDLVNLRPEFAEGWNARATAYYHNGDYGRSLADIAEALAIEPRHYSAMTGLGMILEELGYAEEALRAYRGALEVHPHLEAGKQAVERLASEVDGREA